jgi:pyridine nucleotide-disulfide oxidoreductase family protein
MPHLVLIGGGHSHVICLKLWGQKPLAGVKLTLISNVKRTPYSGMLPALLAGYYSYEESHINLIKLAQFAQAELIIDPVIDLDPVRKQIICQSNRVISFDLVSIDIGSTPQSSEIKGANLYTIPAKPVDKLLKNWQTIVNKCQQNQQKALTLTIIGGGAGGVELALNMHACLKSVLKPNNLTINLIHRGKKLLPFHNEWVSYKLTEIIKERQINLYLSTEVKEVEHQQIICQPNLIIKSNYSFLVTQAQGSLWLKNSQIATNEEGFILVKDSLQTFNFDYIFATGDIANMINFSLPKAGVFAVRQGKPLYQNLVRFISGKKLRNYRPPSKYLNLIGTGEKSAIASWGYLGWESPLLWILKDYLDRRFMQKFHI